MRSDQERHPTGEVLELYSFGRLPGSELERVENHLFVCEQCQDELVAVDCSIREIKEACQQIKRQPERVRVGFLAGLLGLPRRPVFAGAFAAIALAVVVPVSMYHPGTGAYALINLDTVRGSGEGGVAQAQANRPLTLQLQMPPGQTASAYRAEIVNQSGARLWSGSPARRNGALVMDVKKSFKAGQYWVRLYDADTPIREFGLQLN